jgi:hypothetical protein
VYFGGDSDINVQVQIKAKLESIALGSRASDGASCVTDSASHAAEGTASGVTDSSNGVVDGLKETAVTRGGGGGVGGRSSGGRSSSGSGIRHD